MAWYYKPPQSFPATFLVALRRAGDNPEVPQIVQSFENLRDAQTLAEQYRYFRWAIRQKPEAMHDLSKILSTYDVRTKIITDDFGSILYLIAKPTKLSEFITLNPDLADQVLPDCQ